MERRISGRCACGAVSYMVEAEPVAMLNCHCRDCQRATGSAYSPVVVVPKSAVRMSGDIRYHRVVGDDGDGVERGFCPTCGSSVANKLERLPEIMGLLAGSLDDPSVHKPFADLFTSSAQAWDQMQPDTQKFPKNLTR